MQISNSKFHKIWKISIDQNGNKQFNLGDSKKQQDGSWFNWTWSFCRVVGNAKGVQAEEGDTITINSGKIEQYKNNNGEYKNSITIFEMEVAAKGNQSNGGQQGSYGTHQQKPTNNSYNNTGKPMHNGKEYDPNNTNDPNHPEFIPF